MYATYLYDARCFIYLCSFFVYLGKDKLRSYSFFFFFFFLRGYFQYLIAT